MSPDEVGPGHPPGIASRCSRANCFAPETACNLGSEISVCPYFGRGPQVASDMRPADDTTPAATEAHTTSPGLGRHKQSDGAPLPWTSNALGTVDLEFLAARSNPVVLGIVGNQNAGKTTLLTVLYLLLHAGHLPSGRQFLGSFTLGGWEALAHHLRWSAGQPPSFPPHTPRGLRRMPGLLHLAFRQPVPGSNTRSTDSVEDILLTDPPGEWFGSWAIDRNSPAAEGARWIATNSDAFAFLLDSDALAGPERGSAREQVLRLSQRLGEYSSAKRIAVIWTKSDIPVKDSIRTSIESALFKDLPGHRTFNIQVPLRTGEDPEGKGSPEINVGTKEPFLDFLTWLLDVPRSPASRGIPVDLPRAVRRAVSNNPADPFFSYSVS